MTNKDIDEFKAKLRMKSYGNQTISDNSLLDIGDGIILYPVEGNLIAFDCNTYKEIKKIFISFSLIKIIKKISLNYIQYYLICCENGHLFILDKDFQILNKYIPKEINNVYSLDISKEIKSISNKDKIYQYISISHHSITKEDDIHYITHSKDAISLIQMEYGIKDEEICDINFEKIFTKQSLNNFSVFNYREENNILELFSFNWEETNKYNIVKIYNINKENIINKTFNEKEIIINEMNTEIKRYKEFNNKLVILCKKRNIHIFNLGTLSLDDSFKLEGVGEPGEYYIDKENLNILMVNTTSQLININIKEKINPREIPLNKNENNLSEIILKDDFIRSMNWGLIEIRCKNGQNKVIIINAIGIKIYIKENNILKEDFYSSCILKMSGCGACTLKNNIFAYGDLSGNITIFDNDKEKYEQVHLDKEMIRSLCSDKDNNIIYAGTLSGKIFKYDYNSKQLSLLTTNQKNNDTNENNNNEAITCLKYVYPNLYFSDTGGNIFIYNTINSSVIYNFLPHEPQKDNTNPEFGSLSIKSEVWSFLVHEINNEYIYIITCSEDQSVKIWKIKLNIEKDKILENKLIKEIKEHKYAVTCLDWIYMKNNKKDLLLTCSDDKTINIFDASNEKFDMILKTDFDKCIRGFFTLTYCSFNHGENINEDENNLLCLGTQAGYLIIYDFIKKEIKFLEKIHYGGIEGIVFENNMISTCGNDNIFNIIAIVSK